MNYYFLFSFLFLLSLSFFFLFLFFLLLLSFLLKYWMIFLFFFSFLSFFLLEYFLFHFAVMKLTNMRIHLLKRVKTLFAKFALIFFNLTPFIQNIDPMTFKMFVSSSSGHKWTTAFRFGTIKWSREFFVVLFNVTAQILPRKTFKTMFAPLQL